MSRSFKVPVLLPSDPVAALDAATKQYVDAQVAAGGGAAASGPGLQRPFKWSTDTTATNPGAGYAKCNNAAPDSATVLYISGFDSNGNPWDPIIDLITPGWRITFLEG